MRTVYAILSLIFFAWFAWQYLAVGIPHLPLLMFAMFFVILERFEKNS